MTPSMNLTVERGPSVWDQKSHNSFWPAALMAAGASMAALSLRAAPRHRLWLASAGAAAVAYAVFNGPLSHRVELARVRARERARSVEPLDKTLRDSFPASDPPAI
jgi:type II secretory pathway component PulM